METTTLPGPAPTPAEPDPCGACAADLVGQYCHACGERRPSPDDERLGPFLRDQFHEVTSADGRLWRTLRALPVPGTLTDEYFAGRRGLYVRPVRLFLVLNVLLFLTLAGSNGSLLKGPLRSHTSAALYGPTADRMADDRAAAWGVERAAFEAAFDARAVALAPSLVGVLIPGLALALALTMWPARDRPVRHVVLATHLVSVLIALLLVLFVGMSLGVGVLFWVGVDMTAVSLDPFLMPAFLLLALTYLVLSVRRVYGVGWAGAAAAGLLVGTVGLMVAFWAFRAALFAVAMATVRPPA